MGEAAAFGLNVRGVPVTYDARAGHLSCRGAGAPLQPKEGRIRLEILADRTSVEVFANDGERYLPVGAIPPEANRTLEAFSREGTTRLCKIEVWRLRSAWPAAR